MEYGLGRNSTYGMFSALISRLGFDRTLGDITLKTVVIERPNDLDRAHDAVREDTHILVNR